jgi:outer membrane protein OmpA-like peptidoglycan-associated protein
VGPHGTFTLDRAETIGHLETTGGLYLDYLSEPFVVQTPDGEQSIVDQQLAADLVAGIGLFGRARLGVHLPVYFVNSGDIGETSYSGSGIGDLTFQPKVRLLKQPEAPMGLGLQMDISVPTGNADRFIGEPTATVAPVLLADRRIGKTTIETNLGFRFKREQLIRDVEIGDRFTYGIGAEYALVQDVLQVGLEVFGHTPLKDAFGLDRSSPLETLVGAKVTPGSGITISSGIGGGIIGGIGAPEFRAFIGVSYAPTGAAGKDDGDGDGIAGEADECPDRAEDFDGYEDEDGCPDNDNDGDGVMDDNDACPNKPAGEGSEDGCPVDKAEESDQSDDQGGRPDDQEKSKAKDTDGDGVADEMDECPETPGVGYKNGCPPQTRRVELKERAIDALQKIYFETDSAELESESTRLLDQVALLLRLNPQIKQVEIQGHTDNKGTDKYNQKLSERRAETVRRYLVDEAGIASDRLTAEGYGKSRPKVPNATGEERSKNRRVEFVIVMQESVDGSREGTESTGDASDGEATEDASDGESTSGDEGAAEGETSESESSPESDGSGETGDNAESGE